VIFISSGAIHENIHLGARSVFQRIELPIELRVPGAATFGFAPAAAARLGNEEGSTSCAPHPLALPLNVGPEPGAAAAVDDGSAATTLDATVELQQSLRRLSKLLLHERRVPLRLWHVVLESYRGDDIHALNDQAPADLAPVAARLYARAAGPRPSVIAPRNHYGAGTRTSQGLSAMTCGLGTMPMGLSFGRDFGLLPLRCLPDVLKDAAFSTAFYYGSTPDFDNMRAFLNYHGIDRLVTKLDFQQELGEQDWGAPDWATDVAVFRRALADSTSRPANDPQYNLVLSLTNHFPFSIPPDGPTGLAERVRRVIEKSGRPVGSDDAARLATFAYTDHALGELVEAIEGSEAAAQSLIVIAADHPTSDFLVWQDWGDASAAQRKVPLTRIPLFVVFPPALIAASADPERTRAAIERVNEILRRHPTSQNDVPLLVLELLSHLRQLRSIPEAWRWHTIGGQRMSVHFRAPRHPEAAVLGVDGASRVFVVGGDGVFLPVNDVARPTFDLARVSATAPDLLPATAFLAAFIQSYGSRCWQVDHIRRRR
jgi:hypothetical protein